MDEAAECDALLLMRDGAILAAHHAGRRCARETGERDLGRAFLAVIRDGGVSARVTLATAQRVLWQIRHDPRTIALLLVVPAGLLVLLRYVLDGRPGVFQAIGAPLCGLFPFIAMFLVTSIAMLRERTTGHARAADDAAAGQARPARRLRARVRRPRRAAGGRRLHGRLRRARPRRARTASGWSALLAVGNAVLGMALGLFVSAFARTEFQAVQFMPALVLPQLLLCGLFVARDQMAPLLYAVSWALPFTYAYDALARATRDEALGGGRVALDAAVLLAATTAALWRSAPPRCAGTTPRARRAPPRRRHSPTVAGRRGPWRARSRAPRRARDGRSGRSARRAGGGSWTCAHSLSRSLSPSNGSRPVSAWKSTHASA